MTSPAWDGPAAALAPGPWLALNRDRHVDAYLVWDRLTDQARHYLPGPAGARLLPGHVPVMVQFKPGQSLQGWCQPARGDASAHARRLLRAFEPSVALAPASSIHCGIVPADLVDMLLAAVAAGVLLRFQLGAPCRVSTAAIRRQRLPVLALPEGLALHTLGVIDDGCCLAHRDFQTPDAQGCPQSRVLALWDQDPAAPAAPAGPWVRATSAGGGKPVGYGAELLAEDTSARLASSLQGQLGEAAERVFYQDLGRPHWGGGDHTHGARVMHLLAGPLPVDLRPSAAPLQRAPVQASAADQLPVIFVQLPAQTVADTSGDSLPMHVVDGARYIAHHTARRAGPGRDWRSTINISVGSIAGPHDGSAMSDLALAELAGLPNVEVVVAAGNTGDRQGVHAQRSIAAGRPGRFLVCVPPDTGRDTFVEFWLPTDLVRRQAFSVQLRPPAALGVLPAGRLKVGAYTALRNADGQVLAAAVLPRKVAQGLKGTMLLLAIAPTRRDPGAPGPMSPPGVWTVEIALDAQAAATVHAWVERDDVIIGGRRPQRARFEQDSADGAGPSYITDSHTLASLAHAAGLAVAGATVLSSGAMARYSGQGPSRTDADGAAPTLPNWFAPSERSPSLRGLAVPGFFSGSRAVFNGTSAAAPQVARHLAELALAGQQADRYAGRWGPGKAAPPPPARRPLRAPVDPSTGGQQRRQPVPQGARLVPRPRGRWDG